MSAYQPAYQPYVFQEFPKWKHCSETGESRVINDAEEEEKLEGNWFDTLSEATEFKAELSETGSEVKNELDELLAKAQELGIVIDKRWGLKRLRTEVEGAQAQQ